MKIKDYCEYQRESMNSIPQNIRDKNNMIKYAKDIDISAWRAHIDHLENRIPPHWLFKSNYDALGFLKSDIKGITHPKIHLKVTN